MTKILESGENIRIIETNGVEIGTIGGLAQLIFCPGETPVLPDDFREAGAAGPGFPIYTGWEGGVGGGQG